jgi:hypothetical protein
VGGAEAEGVEGNAGAGALETLGTEVAGSIVVGGVGLSEGTMNGACDDDGTSGVGTTAGGDGKFCGASEVDGPVVATGEELGVEFREGEVVVGSKGAGADVGLTFEGARDAGHCVGVSTVGFVVG